VVATTGAKSLALEAIDPGTGRTLWQVPYSVSDINAGIPITPLFEGGTVVDLAPTGDATDPEVDVEGIDVETGKTSWSEPGAVLVTDAPESCTSQGLFCINEVTANGSSTLTALQPSSGSVVVNVPDLNRQLAPDLYELDSSPVSLEQLGASGQAVWTVPVGSLFGSTEFSPDYGWNFSALGTLDVGTVGAAPEGANVPLADYRTIGVRSADGSVAWSAPGSYQCLGALRVSVPFVCRYGADGRLSGSSVSATGVSLTLEGLNPQDGSITWSRAVSDAEELTDGSGVVFASATRVEVTLASGAAVLLDLSTGATSTPSRTSTYWCSTSQAVPLVAPPAGLVDGERTGASAYFPCSDTGAPVTAAPATTPSNIGVVDDGYFVWPSPEGLRAVPLTK
jgi:hypothetical protein